MVALLQYVANQLKSSESLDLLVLKEMVATMTASRPRPHACMPCPVTAGRWESTPCVPPAVRCAAVTGCRDWPAAPQWPRAAAKWPPFPKSPPSPPPLSPNAMQGHQAVFDVSEHQLDALAGSDTLIAEVITQVGCKEATQVPSPVHTSNDTCLLVSACLRVNAFALSCPAGRAPQQRQELAARLGAPAGCPDAQRHPRGAAGHAAAGAAGAAAQAHRAAEPGEREARPGLGTKANCFGLCNVTFYRLALHLLC